MRLLLPMMAFIGLLTVSACADFTVSMPPSLDTTAEFVADMTCSQASATLATAETVLDYYAATPEAVAVAAPVLTALGIDLTSYVRVENVLAVEGVVVLLEDRLTACA